MTALRESIVDAWISAMQGITVAGGYLNTVILVEQAAKPDDQILPADLPWIGVVPLDEVWIDTSGGYVEVTWDIETRAYLAPSAKTVEAVGTALANITADIRKAIYSSGSGQGNLGVSGVIWARLTGRSGSEASPEFAARNIAATVLRGQVKFREVANG